MATTAASSSSMEADPPSLDVAWAQSLVGKDWEIYWEQGGDDDGEQEKPAKEEPSAGKPRDEQQQPQAVHQPVPTSPLRSGESKNLTTDSLVSGHVQPQLQSIQPQTTVSSSELPIVSMESVQSVTTEQQSTTGPQQARQQSKEEEQESTEQIAVKEEDESDSEVEEEPTDWYDGNVIGFSPDGVFHVRFVGDDDSVYPMMLTPAIVRPSARAWTKRTLTILERKSSVGTDFSSWAAHLPVDTATLQDQAILAEKQQQRMTSKMVKERQDVMLLRNLLESQIYLRSKLAPMADSSGGGSSGEPAITDNYLNHLVKCLQDVVQLCDWYEKCWVVHEQAMGTSASNTPVSVELVEESCLETGRERIVNFLTMDLSRSGAKKRPPTAVSLPNSPRNTKRRKVYKASGFLQSGQSDKGFSFDEEQPMTLKTVKQFVSRVEQEERQWFVSSFMNMLQTMCSDVQDPIRTWTRQAELILGERDESGDDDDSNSKDQEMSEDDAQDDDDASSTDSERYYSYEDVEACMYAAEKVAFLTRIDLAAWTTKLQQKLAGIATFEQNGWRIISRVTEEVGQREKASDDVLVDLTELQEGARSTNEYVKNVDPLGRSSSSLTRTVIENAIAVREWILDLRHVERVRERVAFVQSVVSQAPTLPHVPAAPREMPTESSTADISSRLEEAMSRIQGLSSSLYSHVQLFNRYDSMIAHGTGELRSTEGVQAALDELGATPVLSLVEEKLSVRYDVLRWLSRARASLPRKRKDIEYDVLEVLKGELDAIVNGLSPSRSQRLLGLERNAEVDNDIRKFAKDEVTRCCAREAATVEELFSKGRDWKDRADAIITALRIHGNPTAGASVNSTRPAAMVDLKRIDDLLSEYGRLGSKMEKRRDILKLICDEANSWCTDVEGIVRENSDVLEHLTAARDYRPKGVVMDPARHVVDSWIELLEWHHRVCVAFHDLVPLVKSNTGGSRLSTLIAETIHPLMIEGLEIIAFFSRSREAKKEYSLTTEDLPELHSRMQESNKLLRTVSVEKLESNDLGNLVLSRIVDSSWDAEQDSPLLCLLLLTWRVSVIHLLHRQSSTESTSSGEAIKRPTLEEAKALLSSRPCFPDSSSETISILSNMQTPEILLFEQLVSDGDQVEKSTRTAIAATKDVARASFDKSDEVREHLTTLKDLQANFKRRGQENSGLVLSQALEKSLDNVVKDLSWLVRTLPYLALHSDDVPDQNDEHGSSEEESEPDNEKSVTIPWDVLVSLHERLPDAESDGVVGDIARVSLRVKELYEVANAWQEDITSQLALSFRGAKRRVPGANESDGDLNKTDLTRLAQLAQHPILARVTMPRETAVQQVLDRSCNFEQFVGELFGVDFDGSSADKAPYPESTSLVGEHGEFLLFRLTGSTLYESLKALLEKMSSAADDALADTPGKAAFDWIVKAVAWIDELNDAVTEASVVTGEGVRKMVIPFVDAMKILEQGNALFLEITDELRRTLAAYKIFLSTNKQTARLTVTIGKDGAMHSLGGTAVKWCPLLLECLKEDLARQQQWEARAVQCFTSFNSLIKNGKAPTRDDREGIHRWLHYRERFSVLLDEATYSLVIASRQSIVASILRIIGSVDTFMNSLTSTASGTPAIDARTLMAGRYEDAMLAVEDSLSALDALLNRRSVEKSLKKQQDVSFAKLAPIPDGPTFRDKARSALEKAMKRGVQMMSIDSVNANISKSETSLYCAMKAWEIEELIFEASRKEPGSKIATDKYRDKLRSLRFNLEDPKNPCLCPRVLVGDITARRLVTMSSEELAGKQVRLTRAKAEEEGRRSVTVNPGVDKKQAGTTARLLKSSLKMAAGKPVDSPEARKALLSLPQDVKPKRSPPSSGRPVASIPPTPPEGTALSSGQRQKSADDSSLFSSTPSPRLGKSTLKIGSLLPAQLPPPPIKVTPASAASLPTPPSLAVSTAPSLAVARAPVMPSQATTFVENANGGGMFSISVANSTRVFQARLQVEGHDQSLVDRLLPELLTEKGRIKIEEFSRFLKSKLSRGKWIAVPLRLEMASNQSASEHRKFQKDYENKKRVAMFAVGKEERMYLVTPKFHSSAKMLSFESRSSTYAVLLMRAT